MSYPYVTAAPYLDGRYVPYQQNNVSVSYTHLTLPTNREV